MALPDNATIVAAVWAKGTNDFQQRITEPTQGDISQTVRDLFNPENLQWLNEFQVNLINLIGNIVLDDWNWEHPFQFLKRNDLLEVGDKIEEIQLDLIESSSYNMRDSNIFKRNPGEVYSAFHTINRREKYLITINYNELRAAFNSTNGLSNFLTSKLNLPYKSDQYDEYRIILGLLEQAYQNNGMRRIKVHFEDPTRPTKEEILNLSTVIRTVTLEMTVVPNTRYNRRGIPIVSQLDDLLILITPGIKSRLETTVMADAFHVEFVELKSRIIVVDEIPIPGAYVVIMDRKYLIMGDYVNRAESFYNPANMELNSWLHRWGIYSTSAFQQVAVLGEDDDTVIPVVTVTLDSISARVEDEDGETTTYNYEKAEDYKLVVTGNGDIATTGKPETAEDFIVPSAYVADVVLEGEGVVQSNFRTGVGRNGALHIQDGLPAGTKIKINVSSAYVDPSTPGTTPEKTASVTLTVAGNTPSTARVAENATTPAKKATAKADSPQA